MATVTLKISGMTCGGCVRSVENALKRVKGVQSAQVDLKTGVARVEGDMGATDLVAAAEAAGFGAVNA